MKYRMIVVGVAGMLLAGVALMNAQGNSMQGTMKSPAPAQGSMMASSDHAAVEAAIKANETKLNDAFPKKDMATIKMYVAEDGMMMDTTGVMMTADMFKQLPTMDMKVTEQALTNFKFLWVDANTVVVTYTWTGKGMAMGQSMPSPAYFSTVWNKRGAKWVAVFHQEVAAAPMMKK